MWSEKGLGNPVCCTLCCTPTRYSISGFWAWGLGEEAWEGTKGMGLRVSRTGMDPSSAPNFCMSLGNPLYLPGAQFSLLYNARTAPHNPRVLSQQENFITNLVSKFSFSGIVSLEITVIIKNDNNNYHLLNTGYSPNQQSRWELGLWNKMIWIGILLCHSLVVDLGWVTQFFIASISLICNSRKIKSAEHSAWHLSWI